LGPDHFGIATAAGAVASLGILGLLLRAWSGPWRVESSEFDLRFAGTLVATGLVSQYIMLHDLTILILAAALLAARWLGHPNRPGWGAIRAALAVVWIVSLLGPLLSVALHVQLVPLALLLLGAVIGLTLPRPVPDRATVVENASLAATPVSATPR
jgi:hypothetical protein